MAARHLVKVVDKWIDPGQVVSIAYAHNELFVEVWMTNGNSHRFRVDRGTRNPRLTPGAVVDLLLSRS